MAIAATMKGEFDMAYETKVILISLAELALRTNDIEEIYDTISKMANAEGVILKSYDEAKAEMKEKEKKRT